MNRLRLFAATLCVVLSLLVTGCARKDTAQTNQTADTGPVPTKVEPDMNSSNFKVEHPEHFPLATASEYTTAPELNVTGVINPDLVRQVPVPSPATGRVLEIDARLGDEVKKGQLLFKVRSNDIAGAYSDYRKAIKNEQLAKIQLERAKILFDDGATPKSALEIAGDGPHVRSQQFAKFQTDAPACDNCGAITVRNGNCYLCHNCGNSMGCS